MQTIISVKVSPLGAQNLLQCADGAKKWGLPDKLRESQHYPPALGEAVVKAWLPAPVLSEHKPMVPPAAKFKARYSVIEADLAVPGERVCSRSRSSSAPLGDIAADAADDPWSAAPLQDVDGDDASDDPWATMTTAAPASSESDPWVSKRRRV